MPVRRQPCPLLECMAAAITFEILLGWFSQRLSFSTAHDESLVKLTLIGNSSSHVFRSPFLLQRTRPEVPSQTVDGQQFDEEDRSNRLSVSYPVYPLPKTANLPNLGSMKNRPLISASEVSDFVFCRLSWALKYQQGLAPNQIAHKAQAAGQSWHARQGKRFASPVAFERAGAAIIALGVFVVIVHWLIMRWSR